MITQNEHRNSFAHDEIDFDAVAADLDLARKSQDMRKSQDIYNKANAPEFNNQASAPNDTENPMMNKM
jgi:hypothetical protein